MRTIVQTVPLLGGSERGRRIPRSGYEAARASNTAALAASGYACWRSVSLGEVVPSALVSSAAHTATPGRNSSPPASASPGVGARIAQASNGSETTITRPWGLKPPKESPNVIMTAVAQLMITGTARHAVWPTAICLARLDSDIVYLHRSENMPVGLPGSRRGSVRQPSAHAQSCEGVLPAVGGRGPSPT